MVAICGLAVARQTRSFRRVRPNDRLALWHDRNRNGVSGRGEVRPVTAWGIAALSTAYDFDATHPHEIPWSSAGVRFADGAVRPTFDAVVWRR